MLFRNLPLFTFASSFSNCNYCQEAARWQSYIIVTKVIILNESTVLRHGQHNKFKIIYIY